MYSKYVLNSNWVSLSSYYKYDSDLKYIGQQLPVDGNLTVTYTSYLSNIKDYSNNNYSLFFLSDKKNINSYISNNVPTNSINNNVCVIIYDFIDGLISETTRFLNVRDGQYGFNNVIDLDQSNFFEIDFINQDNLLLKKIVDNVNYYLVIDDISKNTNVLTTEKDFELDVFTKDKVKLNYILDGSKIVIYKVIQGVIFFIGIDTTNDSIIVREGSFDDIPTSCLLYYVKIGDLPSSLINQNIIKYDRGIFRNNLNINPERSIKNTSNNLLLHTEYNNIHNNSFSSNFLTLKNQLDGFDEAHNNYKDNSFREYTNIFTGGNREDGSNSISLNFKTEFYPLVFKTDMVTWFHVPYNSNLNKVLINDANFVINGAVGGSSPILSDKIWKKIGNYSETSNLGTTTDREHTGKWLCSWLSAGSDGTYTWMDRYYNPSSFTPYQALKYNTNVEYTPEYSSVRARDEGVSDIISDLSLEPGVWYAYSHIGKNTVNSILSGIKSLSHKNFKEYKNKLNKSIIPNVDEDGDSIYDLSSDKYGVVNLPTQNFYNNFSISFYGTRKDWNTFNINNLLGNYIDSGFGIINSNKFNPLIYYINDKVLHLFNNEYKKILTIDTNFYLSGYGDNYSIVGIFRRDYNENFHIITSNFKILEFTSNGTITDSLDFTDKIPNTNDPESIKIDSLYNNTKNGVIGFSNNALLKINLLTNTLSETTSGDVSYINASPDNNFGSQFALIDGYNNIFVIRGYHPIIKGTNIYYKSIESDKILVYSGTTSELSTYLQSSSGSIISFGFDTTGKTFLLYEDRLEEYNELGEYTSQSFFTNLNSNLTACNISFQNLLEGGIEKIIHFIDEKKVNYLYNFEKNFLKQIDPDLNERYSSFDTIKSNNYDFTNYNYIQGIIDNSYPLPSYNFKIKLFNQLDYEDSIVLNTTVLGETLDSGTHHFCVVFDTLQGEFSVYINGNLYSKKTFPPKRYSYSSLLTNNIVVGGIPFYGGTLFNDFYKSNTVNLFSKDLIIEKFKFFNNSINLDEIKMLYYEKYPPEDIVVNLEIGKRNYLDTITRTFRHKMQGSKSNLINLYINNSLITDKFIQEMYNTIILKDIKPYLPSYVKINKIIWINTIDSEDKLIVGNFSVKNSLTDTEDTTGL